MSFLLRSTSPGGINTLTLFRFCSDPTLTDSSSLLLIGPTAAVIRSWPPGSDLSTAGWSCWRRNGLYFMNVTLLSWFLREGEAETHERHRGRGTEDKLPKIPNHEIKKVQTDIRTSHTAASLRRLRGKVSAVQFPPLVIESEAHYWWTNHQPSQTSELT